MGLLTVGQLSFPLLMSTVWADEMMPTQTSSTQPTVSDTLLESTQLGGWLDRFRPPREGKPRSTANGSSRDRRSCNASEPAMQAQLPSGRYGLTLEERPEIFVDISGTSAQQALLIVRKEDSNGLTSYQQAVLPVPTQDGLTGFRFPEEMPALVVGQTYGWSLSLLCGDYANPNDPTFTGWVRRMERSPDAERILSTDSLQAQAQWLSENGYWYDLISRAVASLD